jgi:hypothetical protein
MYVYVGRFKVIQTSIIDDPLITYIIQIRIVFKRLLSDERTESLLCEIRLIALLKM